MFFANHWDLLDLAVTKEFGLICVKLGTGSWGMVILSKKYEKGSEKTGAVLYTI